MTSNDKIFTCADCEHYHGGPSFIGVCREEVLGDSLASPNHRACKKFLYRSKVNKGQIINKS